ncbi:DUF2069 domain-containing protein [Alcaligenaceae bacterium 429]|nr:DUF2069 domain-containing protein [Alcaligenaceae bacterium 429]
MNAQLNPVLHRVAAASLIGLIVLCIAWEMWLAPLRPGGSYMALKVLPLILPLPGILRGKIYTLQWSSMLILLYFMEGCVRAWSDPNPASVYCAIAEIILSLVFYFCAIFYLRPAKKAAKARAKQVAAVAAKEQ